MQQYNGEKRPNLLSSGIALVVFLFLYFGLSLIITFIAIKDRGVVDTYAFNMVSIILSQLLCMLCPVLLVCHASKFDFLSVMRLRKGVDIWQILLLIVMSVGVLFFANGINNIFVSSLEEFAGYVPTSSDFAINSIPQLIFAALLFGILPAFCEEFFYRGLVLRSFESSATKAVLVSGLLFGLMHGNLQQLLFAFIAGCLFAVLVKCTDSLLPAMILHFLNNVTAMVMTYLQQGAPDASQQIPFAVTVMASMVWVILGAILLAGTLVPYIMYTRRRNQRKYGQAMPDHYKSECPPEIGGKRPTLAYVLIIVFVSVQCGYILSDLFLGG